MRVEGFETRRLSHEKKLKTVHIITENLPGTKSVKKIPGIGGLIGQVCSVTKLLLVHNDKPVLTNQTTYCLWYVAVEQ